MKSETSYSITITDEPDGLGQFRATLLGTSLTRVSASRDRAAMELLLAALSGFGTMRAAPRDAPAAREGTG